MRLDAFQDALLRVWVRRKRENRIFLRIFTFLLDGVLWSLYDKLISAEKSLILNVLRKETQRDPFILQVK